MFIVILFIFLGIFLGIVMCRLPQRYGGVARRWLPRATTLLIWLLLFLLGIEVGGNHQVMAALPTLGIEAVAMSLLAVLGSCLLSWLLWRSVHRREHRPAPKTSEKENGE